MQISEFQKNLKQETSDIHSKAENHPIMQSFVKGTFKKEHLLRFLVNVRPAYDVVEQRLLQPYILKNSDLKRTTQIDKDIALLAHEVPAESLASLLTPLECTDLWVAWCWAKPAEMLKAELYVRWLADLYGGRMMARNMGEFTNSVTFNDPGKAISDIREILDTVNTVLEDNDVVEETLKFFEYHLELFTAIENE